MKARIILLTLALLAVFSLGSGGWIAYMALHQGVEREEQVQTDQAAYLLSTKINIFLNASRRSVHAMATLPEVVQLLNKPGKGTATVHPLLAGYCRALEGDICYIMDVTGNTLAASNWQEPTSLVGKNYAFRPYFKQAMGKESGYYAAMGVTTKVRGLYVSHPVQDSEGLVIGVAVIKYSLSALDKEFQDSPAPVVLTDENGIVFASNRSSWLFHSLMPIAEPRFKAIAEALKLGDKPLPVLGLMEVGEEKQYVLQESQERYWVGEKPIPLLPGWSIRYFSPPHEDSVTEILHRLGYFHTLMASAILVIVLGVWFLFRMGLRDIARRQKAERELNESRMLVQDVVDQQNDAVFRMLPDATLTFFNAAFAQVVALPDDFLKRGGRLAECLPLREWRTLQKIIKHLTPTVPSHESQREMEFIDGRKLHFLMRYRAFFQDNGTLMAIQGVWSDVTRLTLQEERLRILSRATEESPAIVMITDAAGKIEYINHRFSLVTGYSKEQVLGQNPALLKSGEMELAVYEQLWHTILKGEIWRGELLNRRRDGALYWVNAAIAPITGQNGEIAHFVGVQEEITDQKLAAAEMLRAKELAEEATRAKSEFLANMSHEIRTPMNAIIGMTTLCLQTDLSVKQRDYLQKIESSSRTLLGIINNILDFSKLEANRLEVEEIPFSLSDVLHSLSSLMGVKAGEKGLEFMVRQEALVPDRLAGDALRLEQVLINLASNAVKFTDRGEVVLHVKVLDEEEETIRLGFSVQDSGIGMNEQEKSRLFRSFSQGDVSITRKYGGTGLGLAISQRLVRMMGGKIQVESAPGAGSVFYFDALFKRVGEEPLPRAVPLPVLLQSDWLTPLRGKRILLVEDNKINQQVAEEFLQKVGIVVHSAVNGGEAVRLVGAVPCDGVLMDVQMPVMDGLEATRRIRLLPEFADLPIIAMTANALNSDRERCLEAGMNDHIIKPMEPERLYSVLCKWLAGGEPQRSVLPVTLEEAGPARTVNLAVAGMDTQAALDLLDGNEELLIKLWHNFPRLHGNDVQLARQAWQTGDRATVKRLAHTLKSVAGNLGAVTLQAASAWLDRALTDPTADCSDGVENFCQAIEETCQAIEAWREKEQPEEAGGHVGGQGEDNAWHPLYRRLLEQLRQSNLDALETWSSLLHHLRGRLDGQGLEQVTHWIDNFDYEQAEKALASLLAAAHLIVEEKS